MTEHLPSAGLLVLRIVVGVGALLIVGLVTPLVGGALAADMFVAIATDHLGHGFFVDSGGFAHALLLAGASLTLVLAGAGRFSVDARLRSRPRSPTSWFRLLDRPASRGSSAAW
jgi:putative oxidoreductase